MICTPIFINGLSVRLDYGCTVYTQLYQQHKESKSWYELSKEECHHLYGFIEHFHAKGLHQWLGKCSNLTGQDIFICYFCCFKHTDAHQLAAIMNISPDSLTKHKQRLKKKLGITSDLPLHLYLKDSENWKHHCL